MFKDISIDINKGDIVGIYGKSGSGKSSLIKLIMGLMKCSSGEIFLDDQNISKKKYFSTKFIWLSTTKHKNFNSSIRKILL